MKNKSIIELMIPIMEEYNRLNFSIMAKIEAEKCKDQSGILMMATHKNVMPYSIMRDMVKVLLTPHPIMPYVTYTVKESIYTEVIYLASKGELTAHTLNNTIAKWNKKEKK